MKRVVTMIVLATVCMATQAQEIKWRLEGTVTGAEPLDSLELIDTEAQCPIATVKVVDGRLVPAEGVIEKPSLFALQYREGKGWIGDFVLENGTTVIQADVNQNRIISTVGTPMNDDLNRIYAIFQQISTNYDPAEEDAYNRQVYAVVKDVVTHHADDLLGAYAINITKSSFSPGEALALVKLLSPRLQETTEMERLAENLQLHCETDEGCMFRDLTGTDVNGLPIHLSDFVGQGHYVLADFWASWCGPCKAMMPEVMQIYEAYKDRGLQVVGVTLQDKPETANCEVQQLGITFPQIYGSTPMTTYGITAIPAYILFAPDGTILTRRSFSLQALKYKLEQLLPQAPR